jgi:hypothetical protein
VPWQKRKEIAEIMKLKNIYTVKMSISKEMRSPDRYGKGLI